MSGEPKDAPKGSRDSFEWARDAAARKAVLFHPGTFVVGMAKRAWSGEGDDCRADPAGNLVRAPVLELEQGHAFLARPDSFVELEATEAGFFEAATGALTGLVVGMADLARARGVPEPTAVVLIVAALRAQLAALDPGREGG